MATPPDAAENAATTGGNGPDDVPIDEGAEAAFLGEARERGEAPASPRPTAPVEEISDSKSLPPLAELVDRIPAEVRETLEDLFRAKFVAVRRLPAKALKP